MPSFTLDSVTHFYTQDPPGRPENTHSWEYGRYPKVRATLPTEPTPVTVYAYASRWNGDSILVGWEGDDRRKQWMWVNAAEVERATASEWDIWEYHRCPENLRGVRWGDRLPGFLPA
ncbi:hypothetical protein ABC337_15140 [Arthrobacter sp. 1P04PC]|uniref:hypothetical protein n=1 Tax=unclassified Arthrobacter TaxID=235627 RepID=UPI0039A09B1C